jgi:hypothetical protein
LSLILAPTAQRGAVERLLASAKIKAIWSPARSADAIRARDAENLIREIAAMAEAPAEEDLAVGEFCSPREPAPQPSAAAGQKHGLEARTIEKVNARIFQIGNTQPLFRGALPDDVYFP